MVSLNDKIIVGNSLKESPKAFALFSYLFEKDIKQPEGDCNETDRIYYSLLDALNKNNIKSFKLTYEELSQRRVLIEQPIIYDNYLLFILINGVTKFNLNKDWIKSVIHLRDTTNEPEKAITTSFMNLLNRNYLTTEGIASITLATLIKQGELEINPGIVKNSFQSNKNLDQYLQKDLFIASICLYTNDYIISISISEDGIELKRFETIFLKRIVLLQNLFYFLIILLLVFIWFYLIQKYPAIKEYANNLGMLLALIGIGLFAFAPNKIKSKFGSLLKLFFGYRKTQVGENE